MIFFENCRPVFWGRRYLSFRWFSGHRFRPPTFLLVLLLLLSSTAFGMQLTLSLKSVPLETAFAEIKKQSGYGFWYEKKDLEGLSKVSLELKNADLATALEACLKGQPLSYQIFDKTVVLKRKAIPAPVVSPTRKSLQEKVKGKVVDAQTKEPLAGVLVKVKVPAISAVTDDKGIFELTLVAGKYDLVVQYLGYGMQEMPINLPLAEELAVSLISGEETLNQVQVVSTGYQTLPKERATGSFTVIDNSLINRSVSTNILDRIDGITSGLIFTQGNSATRGISPIEIRGRSTLFSNAQPLIILDNFPYDGDLGNINPNDIENIAILKDAAAASIWGSRSGNGVIVITTKKGRLNLAPKVGLNANVMIGDKPDLYYRPQLTSSEFIDVEQFLFNRGAFNNNINNGYSALSPAVEIMLARRNGTITEMQESEGLDRLRTYDVRNQALQYYYRPSMNQQYQANISGGGNLQNYFVSVGYDKNLPSDVTADYSRITINASNTYHLLNDKLELSTSIIYTNSINKSAPSADGNLIYPYTQIADKDGNALVVPRTLRPSYVESAGSGRLLNWFYKPLEELRNGFSTYTSNLNDYRLNVSLKYKILKGFNTSVYYGYGKGLREGAQLHEQESFYARNQINQFTQINQTTGAVNYILPMGAILFADASNTKSNNIRFQANYDAQWGKHSINVLSGTEIRDNMATTNNDTFYGYDPDTETNRNIAVNTTINHPYFYGSGSGPIVISPTTLSNTDRYVSYYFNGAYNYADRYQASLSVRKDESNIFGVATNQKGVPLWSAGLAWTIDKEQFYRLSWLPYLKLRTTFGYTGNVNNSVSAYLTTIVNNPQAYNAQSLRILNPPNPSLRWEKNRAINIGLDFATKGRRLSGSLDWWSKVGMDLIGNSPIAPQTGVSLYLGNSANTLTKGVDIELNSVNLDGVFKWHTTLLYNYSQSKVTDYKVSNGSNLNVVSSNFNNPLVGYPYFSIFSFRYAGLNSLGNPQAYLNGGISVDYAAIRSSVNRDDLIYNGSAVPTSFGSIRNTFLFKRFDLSLNISYKFGYYFRRNSLDNGSLYGTGGNYQFADYQNRWKGTGDELTTNVPALIYPSNVARTSIYTYADILVERGDHIRLRDVRLGYTFSKLKKLPIRNMNLFTYANNLGLIWRANKKGIDPDFVTSIPTAKAIAFGIRVDF